MLARWQFWLTTILALLVALAAGYTMMLYGQNRASQAELTSRAQYIQQSVQLESLYRDIAKALADLAVRNQDRALVDLLASQGITLNAPTPAAPGSSDPEKAARP